MKALWEQLAGKLDQLTLRERTIAFIVAATCVVVLVYAMAVHPLLRQQRGYLERIKIAQGQLKSVNDELLKSVQSSTQDPQALKRERIRKLETSVVAAERMLTQRRNATQLTPEQLTRLLQDVLGGNQNLRLRSLRVLPGASLAQPAPPGGGQQAGSTPPKPPAAAQFYRHGVEIEMTGTYLELLKYLEQVEALPWKLAWTKIDLKTATYPQVELRATLHTVSPSPALLTF